MRVKDGALVEVQKSPESSPLPIRDIGRTQAPPLIDGQIWDAFAEPLFDVFSSSLRHNAKLVEDDNEVLATAFYQGMAKVSFSKFHTPRF